MKEDSIKEGHSREENASDSAQKEKKSIFKKPGKSLGFHKTGLELLKIVHKVDSSAIPLRIIGSVLEAAGAYLNLYLTARLIDTLLAGRFQEGFYYACAVVALGLLFGTVGGLVEKACAVSSQRCNLAFAVMMREKTTSLDYETMEQPQVSDKIFTSERTAQMYGGLGSVIGHYQGMFSGLLEVAGAVGLIGALCFSRPSAEGALLSFAAHPAVSVLILLLFLCLTVIIRKRESSGMVRNTKKYLQDHTRMEMQLNYLLSRVMMNLQAAKVIRIYDMKKCSWTI